MAVGSVGIEVGDPLPDGGVGGSKEHKELAGPWIAQITRLKFDKTGGCRVVKFRELQPESIGVVLQRLGE